MKNDEIKSFYREISDVCRKYDIAGFAGVWFSGAGHEEFGQIKNWDVTDHRMKAIMDMIAEKYERWAKETVGHVGRPLGEIREVRGRGKDQENN